MSVTSVLLTILFCLVLILAAFILVSRRLAWFTRVRIPLVMIVIALGVTVYSIGYLSAPETGPGIAGWVSAGLRALFSTGRMFVMENDIGELGSVISSPAYLFCFGAVMTCAMLTVLTVTLSFFGYRFLCSVRLRFLRTFGTHKDVYVFSALNSASLMLAEDIRKEFDNAVMIFLVREPAEPDEKSLEKQAAQFNYLLLLCPAQAEKPEHFGFYQSMQGTFRFLAMNESDAENVHLASVFSSLLCAPVRSRAAVYVFADTERYEAFFYREEFKGLEVIAVDRPELASRYLMDKLPPVTSIWFRPTGDGHLAGELTAAIVGFSEVTPHLIRQIVTQGQFEGLSLRVIVIDKDISDKAAVFMQRNKQLDRCVKLEFIDIAPCSEAFFRCFTERISKLDYIVCACPHEEDTIISGMELTRMASRLRCVPKIAAYLRDGEAASFRFSGNTRENITLFGYDRQILTAGLVIHETLDRMARAVHDYYRQSSSDDRDWDRLTHYEKQSSRALALHIKAKLWSVGLQLADISNTSAYDKLLSTRPDILMNLSKGEHLRWNAHLFSTGWTQLPFDGTYHDKDTKLRRHPCLTNWEALGALGTAAGRNFQQYDMHLIQSLGGIVRAAGLGIIPIRPGENKHGVH